MIELNLHDSKYLDISRHYLAIYNTKCVQDDEKQRNEALKNALLYCILAPYDNEQHDLLQRLNVNKNLKAIPKFYQLLQLFITAELIIWNGIYTEYEKDLRSTVVFEKEVSFADLRKRVVEHNMRTMARYYTRIRLERMSQLLDLSASETEQVLSNLVVTKVIYAKIDRLSGIVYFAPQQRDPEQVLNDWSHSLNQLMKLLSRTTHLINKEEMVHRHLQPLAVVPTPAE